MTGTPFTISQLTHHRLFMAPMECLEMLTTSRVAVPPEPVIERLRTAWKAATRDDDGRRTVTIEERDVGALILLVPAILEHFKDDDAELAARMDAWPEEIEQAQAELLAALGRARDDTI